MNGCLNLILQGYDNSSLSYYYESKKENRTILNVDLNNETKHSFEIVSKTLTEKIEIDPEKILKFTNWYNDMNEKSIKNLR